MTPLLCLHFPWFNFHVYKSPELVCLTIYECLRKTQMWKMWAQHQRYWTLIFSKTEGLCVPKAIIRSMKLCWFLPTKHLRLSLYKFIYIYIYIFSPLSLINMHYFFWPWVIQPFYHSSSSSGQNRTGCKSSWLEIRTRK